MNTANPNSTHRSAYYWLTLVPLIFGASLAFLKYFAWSAVYSGNYGLPSRAWLLGEASSKAEFYWWVLVVLSVAATVVAIILIPPLESEAFPVGLPAVIRFALAIVIVAGSILRLAYVLSALDNYLK